jgi:hypothetical protein
MDLNKIFLNINNETNNYSAELGKLKVIINE